MAKVEVLNRSKSSIWQPNQPLKVKCQIQHRSDILMKEQVKNIEQCQDLLKMAVKGLEQVKSDDILDKKKKIEEIEKNLEKRILILQVMEKINIELVYAREDLDKALYENHGDINAARKRVIWLEDKMGELCGRKRITSKAPKKKESATMVETEETSENNEKLSDTNQLPEVDLINYPSESDPQHHDTTVVIGTDSVTHNSTAINRDDTEEQDKEIDHSEEQDKEIDHSEEKDKEIDHSEEQDKEIDHSEEQDKEIDYSEEKDKEIDYSEEHDNKSDNSREYKDNESSAEHTKDVDTEFTVVKQSTTINGEQSVGDKKREASPTFLTEVSAPGSLNTKSNRKVFVCTVEEDAARDYWKSEHHRLDLGEYFNELIDNDPLSYHNLGMAVPGCFIEREDSDYDDLPWRMRRRGSDIKDIHRIALDKLAVKLKKMYSKVYDAAMLSVLPSNKQAHNGDTTVTTNKLMSQGSGKKTQDTFALPAVVPTKRGGKAGATKMVYYPKPIPPPEVLPITRTSKDKEFPRYSDAFSIPGADVRRPASRIVDQRNLKDETKLVLYREKPKPKREGPSTTERRFRRMLERDRTLSSTSTDEEIVEDEPVSLRKKLRKSFVMAKKMATLGQGVSGWQMMKQKNKGKEFTGLRWERVKTIVHSNLLSERDEERISAAKQLGLLRCGDTMVFYALRERLQKDDNERVRYEAAKSLILIGCWDNEVLQVVLKFLVTGNTEIRLDMIINMQQGKNVQYVNKSVAAFKELVKVLSHFCCNPDPDDPISMEAAVLLGKLCVADSNAKGKLSNALSTSDDSHVKAKALEILVKQLNCTDFKVVKNIKKLLQTSPVSKHRALATKLLISLGANHPCVVADYEDIYNLLERKLWDEPSHEVRVSAGKALTALGMFSRACESVEKRLENRDEEIRAEAVVSVGTLGMRSEKLTRLLLEMLELDTSEYVRIMIIRAFSTLKLTDKRVVRCLRERERLDGVLGLESRKAVKVLQLNTQESSPKLAEKSHQPHAQQITVG